ncbi:MAG TPA: glycosyl hydrolase family 65 protein [Acidothermaceae bacterium]
MRSSRHTRDPVATDRDPRWTLRFSNGNPLTARVQETLLSLGDGVIGLRGSHEDGDQHEAPLVLAGGVYGGEGPAEHLIAAPFPLSLRVSAVNSQRRASERRILNLRTGVLLRESDDEAGLRSLRFVAAGRRGIVVMRAEGPADDLAPGPPLRQVTDRTMTSGRLGDITWARTTSERGGIAAAAADDVTTRNGRLVVERVAAYAPDARRPPPSGRAVAALQSARRSGFSRLLDEHTTRWARRWSEVCVEIPDDGAAELAARFALFQLWCNVGSRGEAAVGARGLSGTGYAGHVFWDADVFVLPAIASMSPAAARAMLEYRIRRLPQARAMARLRGLDGVRFPWESAALGDDVTPVAGRANGEWAPILNGQLEEHINADVAWAANHYAEWTGDNAFLVGAGRPLVVETARYWASRAHVDSDGSGHIRHVIGPDEYHEDVDDNAYTNILARWNLRRAATLVGAGPDADGWLRVADSLVDGYDKRTRRHEQFTGYYGLEPLLVADIGAPPLAADLLLGSARTSRSQIVKQPDVLMAHHLLPGDLPVGSLTADLEFYLPRTAHGSSLSPAITAALLARAGRPDEALKHLDIAMRIDLDDLTGVTGAGLHLATLAGVWQALLFGFAGAFVRDGVLNLDPHLPRRWGSLILRFRCLSRRLQLRIADDSAVVTVSGPMRIRAPGGDAVRVDHHLQLTNTDTGWVVQP